MKHKTGHHSFHIPVMGTAFTNDTPVKVARYGISSTISCVDDHIIERLRKFYSRKFNKEYIPIQGSELDARALRITAYLNLVHEISQKQFAETKASEFKPGSEITKYFELLAEDSPLAKIYRKMLATNDFALKESLERDLRDKMQCGAIGVNIMTKLDRVNYDSKGETLPSEYSDALAALRGYANSLVDPSFIVFSAGFNGRLYGYAAQFNDFHADENGRIKKKIVLKVNDYRSALTQGKFLAKKGLWVSEYKIESGLNCGGHAFANGGVLLGPVLEEFKQKKIELISTLLEIYNKALIQNGRSPFSEPHPVRITAQGGIGTFQEHTFLMNYYELDSIGWGTPFLLVPEATTVDRETLEKLSIATKDDIFLSDSSPLGVPFSTLMDSASELARRERIRDGHPGSPCFRGHAVTNTEFTTTPICTASRQYQRLKLAQLPSLDLPPEEYQATQESILAKACICHDLGGVAIKAYALQEPRDPKSTPAVCPGPNLAYFSQTCSLREIIDHIYGRNDLLHNIYRPHVFINELKLSIDNLAKEIAKQVYCLNDSKIKFLIAFKSNLLDGIDYYEHLVSKINKEGLRLSDDLSECRTAIEVMASNYNSIFG